MPLFAHVYFFAFKIAPGPCFAKRPFTHLTSFLRPMLFAKYICLLSSSTIEQRRVAHSLIAIGSALWTLTLGSSGVSIGPTKVKHFVQRVQSSHQDSDAFFLFCGAPLVESLGSGWWFGGFIPCLLCPVLTHPMWLQTSPQSRAPIRLRSLDSSRVRSSVRGYENISAWTKACQQARKELGIKGFCPIGGKTAQGKAIGWLKKTAGRV